MEIFLDTAEVEKIKPRIGTGLISGITTNPTLIKKSGGNVWAIYDQLIDLDIPDISMEVVAETDSEFIDRGLNLQKDYGKKATVKLPCTIDGLRACRYLSRIGIRTNVTLVFSLSQAILAATAGATYVSPFVGRLNDNSVDGLALIEQIATLYKLKCVKTKVLAASLRDVRSVGEAFLKGADVCTIPVDVFDKMYEHVLTEAGVAKFNADFGANV